MFNFKIPILSRRWFWWK